MHELIHPGQLAGHRAAVLGAGASGLSAVRLLVALGADVRLLDRKDPGVGTRELVEELGARLEVGEHSREQFADLDLVVASPGIPLLRMADLLADLPEGKVVSELELASWFVTEPVVAITGTNGKTTTTSLIGHILERAGKRVFVGGNIGTPLSEYLVQGERVDVVVLEVSSFQLQNCRSFRPHVGVLLNFSPNHLDYHETIEEYFEAKLKLFARQTENDLAIAPLELKDVLEKRGFTRGRRAYFVPTNRFADNSLPGAHNRANMEAAWLACKAMGVSEEDAARAVADFHPLPHRLQPVAEAGGVLFVDDSKSTTVDSMAAAVTSFDRPVLLLAGGVFKGGEPEALLPLFEGRVRAVGLFGDSREVFEKAWKGRVPLEWSPTLEEAVRKLHADAVSGDVILLSPATASFDLYTDYKARGDDFARIARQLAGEAS